MKAAHWIPAILSAGALVFSAPGLAWADCPLSLIQIGNFGDDQVPGPSATRHAPGDPYGFGDAWFLNWGDSLGYDISHGGFGGIGSLEVRGVFKVLGANPGSTVPFGLETQASGDLRTLSGIDGCGRDLQYDDLFLAGAKVAAHTWRTQGGGYPDFCASSFQVVYAVPVQVIAGEAFELERNVGVRYSNFVDRGSSHFGLSLWFRDLPPGAFVVACDGDTATRVLAVGGGTASGLALDAVWPNPSRGEIRASCALPRGGPVVLRLFDAAGRVRETRIWDAPAASRRDVTLNGSLAPGAYFLQISQGANSATKAVTIVR
jgi:hypothetical protein